jgi:hypothetical protein
LLRDLGNEEWREQQELMLELFGDRPDVLIHATGNCYLSGEYHDGLRHIERATERPEWLDTQQEAELVYWAGRICAALGEPAMGGGGASLGVGDGSSRLLRLHIGEPIDMRCGLGFAAGDGDNELHHLVARQAGGV